MARMQTMIRRRRVPFAFVFACAVAVGSLAGAQAPAGDEGPRATAEPPPALFDAVVSALDDRLFDRTFCEQRLPDLVARFRPAAVSATSGAEERAVVHALLAEVPASHLALLSAATQRRFEAELMAQPQPMLGCTLIAVGGRFFVDSLYDGGPAQAAGLRRGDEVVALDGTPTGASALLDWRCDDAYLADPPTHELTVQRDQRVIVTVAEAGGRREVELTAAMWSGYRASSASVRPIETDGQQLLYVHLWFVFHGRAGKLVETALRDHPDSSGLLLDLRGRGGSALECAAVVEAVAAAGKHGVPTVALVDARTRSAKEVIASGLQRRGIAVLVGEPTAGAVLPASFAPLPDGAVLMLPEHRLGSASERLEGHPIVPEVRAADPLPPVPGRDPILQRGVQTLADIVRAPGSGR